MIKIELEYNPYLLETKILFNGQKPRINSLVEKFANVKLQKWIKKIPKIFFDEMNGYDFEIEFSGTEVDYWELVYTFREQNITEDQVRIFHKNLLNCRTEKIKNICELLSWLEINRSRIFDFQDFKDINNETLDQTYPYILLHGNMPKADEMKNSSVSIECISEVDELKNTDLSDIPITICISRGNAAEFQNSVKTLIARDDIEEGQLFFLIDPVLDNKKLKRIIYDIGIKECNEITKIDDARVKRYIEIFPMTDYIHKNILLFRKKINELSEHLEKESKECEIENKETHAEIDKCDEILEKLKTVHNRLVNRDNLEIPYNWIEINNGLERKISSWRKRKTKIIDEAEAAAASEMFEQELNGYFNDFINIITAAANRTIQEINEELFSCCEGAGFDNDYQSMKSKMLSWDKNFERIFIADILMHEFKEENADQQADLFKVLFGGGINNDSNELQRVYYMEAWRSRALEIIKPKREDLTQQLFKVVCDYEYQTAQDYIEHTKELIEAQNSIRNRAVSKLSGKEKLLQADVEWLTNVQDKLKEIESA